MSATVYVRLPDKSIVPLKQINYEKITVSLLFVRLKKLLQFQDVIGPAADICVLSYLNGDRYVEIDVFKKLSDLGGVGLSEDFPLEVSFRSFMPEKDWLNIPLPRYERHRNAPSMKNSKSKKNPADETPSPMKPDFVYEWHKFDRNAKSFGKLNSSDRVASPYFFDYPIWDEVTGLQPFIYINALSRCTLFDKDITIESGFAEKNRTFITDFFVLKKNSKVACVEVELFSSEDVVYDYNYGPEDTKTVSCLRDVVWQLYSQMVENGLFYGMLTSGDRWCFFTRAIYNGKEYFFGSPTYERSLQDDLASVMTAMMFFCSTAIVSQAEFKSLNLPPRRKDAQQDADNPNSNVGKEHQNDNRPPESTSLRRSTRLKKSPENQLMESPPLTEELSFDGVIANCEIIKPLPKANADVYLARYKNQEIVLKVADPRDEEKAELFDELKKEFEMYRLMTDLQGNIIPELKVAGVLPDGRHAIGVSYCGITPNWRDPTIEKARQVLKEFHQAGYVHGDIKLDQFVLREDGKMFILDFGRSAIVDSEELKKQMFNEEYELRSLLSPHRYGCYKKRRR
jgi:hypothetical protein